MTQDLNPEGINKKWIFLFLVLFIAGIGLSVRFSGYGSLEIPEASDGSFHVNNLSLYDHSLALDGEWRFVWDTLVQPTNFTNVEAALMELPTTWNGKSYKEIELAAHGKATFQLEITFDEPVHEELYLFIPFVHSSYKLFIGNELMAKAGHPSSSFETYVPSARSILLPIGSGEEPVLLTMQVANYAYAVGGIWQSPQLGTRETIRSHYDRQLGFDLAIFGGLLLMGLYHIVLFFLRRSIRSNLYFGLLCLLLGVKSLFTGTVFFYHLVPDASYELCLKMIHLTLFAPLLLFWLFLKELFPKELPNFLGKGIIAFALIGITITLFTASNFYSQLMPVFFAVVAISMVIVLRGIYLGVRRGREGAVLIMTGAICFCVTVLHDIAIDFNLIQNGYMAGAGFFVLIFSQAISLAVKFTNSFKHVDRLTLEKQQILAKQKRMLEDEVARKTLELRKQKSDIEEKNREITDSITYAKRIQNAILPQGRTVKEFLKQSFILYKPKDIIAGDFYWMEYKKDTVFFAAADCTGHGVPGAMVSVICVNGLNRSVREFDLTEPGRILDKTREIVIKEFEKSEEEVLDGMDISLCALGPWNEGEGSSHEKYRELLWAGANNPLWIVRKGTQEMQEIKADKQPIGQYERAAPFTTHSIKLFEGDTLYIFSDGYPDQFGGEKGKKLKSANFKRKLIDVSGSDINLQEGLLDSYFEEWKGELEQIDDVCVIGVQI